MKCEIIKVERSLPKWHLGYCHESFLPNNRGFDYFFGQYNHVTQYYSRYIIQYVYCTKIFKITKLKGVLRPQISIWLIRGAMICTKTEKTPKFWTKTRWQNDKMCVFEWVKCAENVCDLCSGPCWRIGGRVLVERDRGTMEVSIAFGTGVKSTVTTEESLQDCCGWLRQQQVGSLTQFN